MGTPKLRPYQVEAIEAVESYWRDNPGKNPGVSLPTGAGKTVVMAEMARRAVDRGQRVAIIVHRDELVGQTLNKLKDADPMLFTGVVKAAKDEVAAEVVVCSVQTLARPGRAERILPREVVIYDEAHTSASDSAVKVMERLGCMTEAVNAVGFSATFFRADRKALDVIWSEVVFHRDLLWAVEQGYLSDARGVIVPIPDLDLDQVATSGGDFTDRDLGQKMMDAHAAEHIAAAYARHASGRTGISFAPTVAAARAIEEELEKAGIPAATVTGKSSSGERADMYAKLRRGDIQVLSSVGVLTEGFDVPRVDAVLMARPTKSKVLYIQAVGRGLRLFPGKKDCLILDVAGNAHNQSLMSMVQLAGKKPRSEDEGSLLEAVQALPPAERAPLGLKPSLTPEEKEFDPFRRSRRVWLDSRGGKKFLPTDKGSFVFLHELGEDSYAIGEAFKGSAPGRRNGKWHQRAGIPLEMAVDLAETIVEESSSSSTLIDKGQTWRRKKNPPSVSQIGFAGRLGIQDAHEMSKGELTDAINIALASAAID